MLTLTLAVIARFIRWCWTHKRTAAESALCLAFLFLGWRYNSDGARLRRQAAEAQGLAAGVSLQLKMTQNQLEISRRDASGKIVYRNVYVPAEGGVTIDQKERAASQSRLDDLAARLKSALAAGNAGLAGSLRTQIDQVDPSLAIKIQDHGFTVKPGYGFDWALAGVRPRLDIKWAYYQRYGLLVGGGANGVGPGISRHLDDVIWGHPANVELFFQWNAVRFYPGYAAYSIGLRSNF